MGDFNNLFLIKVGARQPVFTDDLYQADGVTPLDLSLATGAKFRMRLETGTSLVISNSVATLSGIFQNHIEYDWGASDTVTAGLYVAEAEIDFAIGSPLVVPLRGYWHVRIIPILP